MSKDLNEYSVWFALGESFVLGFASDPLWAHPRGCKKLFSANVFFRSNASSPKNSMKLCIRKSREVLNVGEERVDFNEILKFFVGYD